MKAQPVIAILVGALALLAAFGFSTPSSRHAELKAEVSDVRRRVDGHDVALAKLDYIIEWVKEERARRRR